MIELKPCPFCGKSGRIKEYPDGMFRVVCENYLCPVESFVYYTAQDAVDWWNMRADTRKSWLRRADDGK